MKYINKGKDFEMIKIDLITGFLGSGKTTFIKKYADWLIKKGYKIGIIENDFGAVNVDMLLLQDLIGERCDIEMISGACDKDCHKRRFKTKLISMAMRGFDRIIIEPSGIYDIDEFFDTLREEPVDAWYEPGNVIAVADAGLDTDLSKEADYLLASQLASAGEIVLSRCQEVSSEKIDATMDYLKKLLESYHCESELNKITLRKDWDKLTDEDFERLSCCGYVPENFEKLWFDQNSAFTSLYFMNVVMPEDKLRNAVKGLMNDSSCGNIFRIKGFMPLPDGKWIEFNATRKNMSIKPIEKGQEVFIVIGERLDKEKINKYWQV